MMNEDSRTDGDDDDPMDEGEDEVVEPVSSKNVELRYNFRRCPVANQNTIVIQIENLMGALSTFSNVKLGRFKIKHMVFCERTVAEITKLFEYCDKKKISWEIFVLDTCIQNRFFLEVLAKALDRSLFRVLEFNYQPEEDLIEDGIYEQYPNIEEFNGCISTVLRDAMTITTQNEEDVLRVEKNQGGWWQMQFKSKIDELFIRGYTIEPRSALTFLEHGPYQSREKAGSIAQRISTTLSRLDFIDVRFGYTYEESDMAIDALSQYVHTNNSLLTLALTNVHPLSDVQIARLLQSLSHHPYLQHLILDNVPWHDETLKALGSLLASACGCRNLNHLSLSARAVYEDGDPRWQPNPGKPNLQNLIHSLAPSCVPMLELILSDCDLDNDDFRLLMHNLWRFPNLKQFDLSYNLITSFDLTTTFRSTTKSKSCNLRTLNMTGNPVFCELDHKKQRQYLTNILCANLGLGNLGKLLDTNASHHIKEYVESIRENNYEMGSNNQFESGGLLSADDVIYSLLHGPVFAGRGSVSTV